MNRNGCVTFFSVFFSLFLGKPTYGYSGYVYQVHTYIKQTDIYTAQMERYIGIGFSTHECEKQFTVCGWQWFGEENGMTKKGKEFRLHIDVLYTV